MYTSCFFFVLFFSVTKWESKTISSSMAWEWRSSELGFLRLRCFSLSLSIIRSFVRGVFFFCFTYWHRRRWRRRERCQPKPWIAPPESMAPPPFPWMRTCRRRRRWWETEFRCSSESWIWTWRRNHWNYWNAPATIPSSLHSSFFLNAKANKHLLVAFAFDFAFWLREKPLY